MDLREALNLKFLQMNIYLISLLFVQILKNFKEVYYILMCTRYNIYINYLFSLLLHYFLVHFLKFNVTLEHFTLSHLQPLYIQSLNLICTLNYLPLPSHKTSSLSTDLPHPLSCLPFVPFVLHNLYNQILLMPYLSKCGLLSLHIKYSIY